MSALKLILVAIGRFALMLALIIVFRLLFTKTFSILWRDLIMVAVFTGVSLVQTHLAKRKQDKIDRMAEANRKNQQWS